MNASGLFVAVYFHGIIIEPILLHGFPAVRSRSTTHVSNISSKDLIPLMLLIGVKHVVKQGYLLLAMLPAKKKKNLDAQSKGNRVSRSLKTEYRTPRSSA